MIDIWDEIVPSDYFVAVFRLFYIISSIIFFMKLYKLAYFKDLNDYILGIILSIFWPVVLFIILFYEIIRD